MRKRRNPKPTPWRVRLPLIELMAAFARMKERWGIHSNWGLMAILLAFSLAGSSVVWIRPIYWKLFGFTDETSMWIKVPTYIALVFPTYQVMLLFFGTVLGQFRFFWEKEKKLFLRMTGRGRKRAACFRRSPRGMDRT